MPDIGHETGGHTVGGSGTGMGFSGGGGGFFSGMGNTILGGLLNLAGGRQQIKLAKYQSQSDALTALAEQRRLEAERRAKQNWLIGGLIFLVVVGIVIGAILYMRKNKKK